MNLQLFKFKVTGIFPLLTHNPASMKRTDSTTVKSKKIPSAEDEAKAGLYLDKDGNFMVNTIGFRSALLNGAKNKKMGKASAISVFQAAVFNVDEGAILIDPKTEKPLKSYTIDTRRAIIQRQGIMRSRPRFEKWACFLYVQIDTDIMTSEVVEEHLNIAGQIIGVGDFRIEKRGPFGKFQVELVKD
jgi:hypothetical protein